jgi:hypothetical protein
MRRAAIVFAIAFGLGIIGVAALGLRHGSNLAYSLGVNPAAIAATLAPGDRVSGANPPARRLTFRSNWLHSGDVRPPGAGGGR